MDFCRAGPGATERSICKGWGRRHAKSSLGIQIFRYSIAEPRPSLKAVKSRRDNVEIKPSRCSWEMRNSWMDQEVGIVLDFLSVITWVIHWRCLPWQSKIQPPLHSLFTHCVVLFFIFICTYIYCPPDWKTHADRVLFCLLPSPYP